MKLLIRLVVGLTIILMTGCVQPATPVSTTSPTVATPLPPVTATLDSPNAKPIREIDTWLEQQTSQGRFTGSVLIASQGEVLLRKGYGQADRANGIPNTPQTRFRLGSVTKQFTAMAILILQSQGKLDVQEHICSFLKDCPATWKDITIHHLLTHTSGIPDFTQLRNYQDAKVKHLMPEQVIALFKDQPMVFRPGEMYSYSNSNYIILGYIIEQASGITYEEFLQKSIFTPLGLENTGYEHESSGLAVGYSSPYSLTPVEFVDMSVPYAAGALYSTVDDLYLWDQALYTEQLIPRDLLENIFTRHIETFDPIGVAYGYGWMLGEENGHLIYTHGGAVEGFRAVIARYPEDRATIIILSNQESTELRTIQPRVATILFGGK